MQIHSITSEILRTAVAGTGVRFGEGSEARLSQSPGHTVLWAGDGGWPARGAGEPGRMELRRQSLQEEEPHSM